MKRFFFLLTLLCALTGASMAQNALNNKAENIVGTYQSKQGEDNFKATITQQKDGTFTGKIIWVEHDKDANGKKFLDEKNPDKKLRNVPCDQIVLFSGLKYDAGEKCWNGTQIYDPQRGIKAKLTAEFNEKGQLKIRGTILGFGETAYWNKIK